MLCVYQVPGTRYSLTLSASLPSLRYSCNGDLPDDIRSTITVSPNAFGTGLSYYSRTRVPYDKRSEIHGRETSSRECTQVFVKSSPVSLIFATRPNRCKLYMSCLSFGMCIASMVLRIVPPKKFVAIYKSWFLDILLDVIRACSFVNVSFDQTPSYDMAHLDTGTTVITGILSSNRLGQKDPLGLASSLQCAPDHERRFVK